MFFILVNCYPKQNSVLLWGKRKNGQELLECKFLFFFSFLIYLTFLPYQSPNLALTHFLPLEKFYLFSSFIPSVPPRPEPALILVVLGSCPMVDMGITYIHSLSQLELDHFLLTSHITGSSHFFGTIDINQPWFEWLVKSFGFLVLVWFFQLSFRNKDYYSSPGFRQ